MEVQRMLVICFPAILVFVVEAFSAAMDFPPKNIPLRIPPIGISPEQQYTAAIYGAHFWRAYNQARNAGSSRKHAVRTATKLMKSIGIPKSDIYSGASKNKRRNQNVSHHDRSSSENEVTNPDDFPVGIIEKDREMMRKFELLMKGKLF
ncbi:unnamed protein product [Notodromas monacha]|uniref:Uncharacterized protein n=1 Tax=Notodromas monacha TaxID=399045 RepID=A0A7R9BHJ3_9CRUS|nr:unnamed protein product [Notodromas monacha]CAG0915349.1 unnamed protein product [Notodromas monacha]